jgi:hypothetical protein
MSKKQYTVLNAVDHDNRRYEAGNTIDLEDTESQVLLALKAIEGPSGDVAPIEPTDPKERLAAITGAIGQIDPNNQDLWLKDGKPSSEAIVAVLGWTISAAERNVAWAALQPNS